MGQNGFSKLYARIKNLLLYKPPTEPHRFVLGEGADDTWSKSTPSEATAPLAAQERALTTLLSFSRQLEALIQKISQSLQAGEQVSAELRMECDKLTREFAELSPITLAYDSAMDDPAELTVKISLFENEAVLSRLFNLPDNKDVVVRKFTLPSTPEIPAMAVFLEGLSDKKLINFMVLAPLMLLPKDRATTPGKDLVETLINTYIPGNQVKLATTYEEVASGINGGDTVVFVDGSAQAFIIETKGWEHRSVGKPEIEPSVRGSQMAFTETLRVNTGLIRSLMRNSDLTTEILTVGKQSKTPCAVMYLKSIANPDLVIEVKQRINGIVTDYVTDAGVLEQLIDDHPNIPMPMTLSTERPDRVAPHLSEGRVAILLEGSPFALVVPFSFISLFHSIDDYAFKPIPGTFMRVLRIAGLLLASILPSLYLAISYFHQEALPTDLLLAIAAARELVPFPAIVEVILMEISFELIREAGTRIPGMLGSTIGIVGAIIIGQAAVAANIVSPIMVVIVAVTGLASFTITDYRLSFGIRLARFGYLLLATMFGLVGVAAGIILSLILVCSMKSFGVPYLVPISPKVTPGFDIVVRGAAYSQETRPDELNTLDRKRQAKVSRR
ncbi:spore germination protein [Sporomusa malonica]|uniref:Spore germination protein KA n=1 Tax=Sporomusa malonica TaxID=112901 RepID=A0A1W2EEL2_9FIRM|nr:spore germination protein [Sporomusa malonica]SMD07832.1 spore germination protein KA [Sporomusa malonica]